MQTRRAFMGQMVTFCAFGGSTLAAQSTGVSV